MWRIEFLIPSLNIFLSVQGIIFPGSCPRTINPPSVSFPPEPLALSIILSVPFSTDGGPYFFQEFGMDTVKVFQATLGIYESEMYLQLDGDFTFDGVVFVYSQIISQQDGELTLNSTITSSLGGDCFPAKTDNIKMWIEGDYVILWSCVGVTDFEYDVGVVLLKIFYEEEDELAYKLYNLNSSWIEPMNHELKDITTKYLSANLMDAIKWWDPKARSAELPKNPFDCPRRVQSDWDRLFRILICYVIFMVLVIFATFEYKCRFRKRDCQVHPYMQRNART